MFWEAMRLRSWLGASARPAPAAPWLSRPRSRERSTRSLLAPAGCDELGIPTTWLRRWWHDRAGGADQAALSEPRRNADPLHRNPWLWRAHTYAQATREVCEMATRL